MAILQLGLLFGFLALGELIVWLTGVPVPSSIIGMLLLTAALKTGIVKLRHVERAANFLVANLGFFFVPAGVSVMLHFDILRAYWLPITVATVVSTVIVFAITGQAHQITRNLSRKYFNHALSRK